MTKTKFIIPIDGQDYVLGPGGSVADSNGNVCGFLGSDIVQQCDPDDATANVADGLVGGFVDSSAESGEKLGPRQAVVSAIVDSEDPFEGLKRRPRPNYEPRPRGRPDRFWDEEWDRRLKEAKSASCLACGPG
ncbi:MAG: hypothetical protein GY949_05810 [Gammaproteobacteria bacterium]|nr:hypothetical protein [Gammaproteobacteria bacterium]